MTPFSYQRPERIDQAIALLIWIKSQINGGVFKNFLGSGMC